MLFFKDIYDCNFSDTFMTGILLKQLNINVLYLFKEMGILLFSFPVNNAAMNILGFLCLFVFFSFFDLGFSSPVKRDFQSGIIESKGENNIRQFATWC